MKRRLFAAVLLIAILAGLAVLVRDHLSLEQLAAHERRLRTVIAMHWWRSYGIGVGLYFVVSLVPGTSGKSILAGWFFGFWPGVIMVTTGLTAAAATMMTFSRYLLKPLVESRLATFVNTLNRAVERDGAFYLLTLRMAHVPFSWINVCCGATRIGIGTFCWTTAVGLLPGTMLFVYLGTQLPTLDELARHGVGGVVGPGLLTALVATAALPAAARWVWRHTFPLFVRRRGRSECDVLTETRPKPVEPADSADATDTLSQRAANRGRRVGDAGGRG